MKQSRIILVQDNDLNLRQDLEISEDGKNLYLYEMSNYWGGWTQVEKTHLVIEVLTKGVTLGNIIPNIEKRYQKRSSRKLFRLVKKLGEGDMTMTEFKRAIKYKPERHRYPKGQPRLQGE